MENIQTTEISENKIKVLFVDDEPNLLAALKRAMRAVRDVCDVDFAEAGQQALENISRQNVDIIVSDMRMPGIDGAELLEKVRNMCPDTVRIILSGQASTESIIRGVSSTHMYLSKPHDPELLRTVLFRATVLRNWVPSVLVRRSISQFSAFPVQENIFNDLKKELSVSIPDKIKISEIISKDLGLIAKVFHIAIATAQNNLKWISSVKEIVDILNLEVLQEAVESEGIFTPIYDSYECKWLKELTAHSLAVAKNSYESSLKRDVSGNSGAYIAGLFHDIGKILLRRTFPAIYRDSIDRSSAPLIEAETLYLGTDHSQVGAYFMGLWGLEMDILNAIRLHHQPSAIKASNDPLTPIVWFANTVKSKESL